MKIYCFQFQVRIHLTLKHYLHLYCIIFWLHIVPFSTSKQKALENINFVPSTINLLNIFFNWGILSERSITIATYALCGFANPEGIGITLATFATLCPERRSDVSALVVRAFVAGQFWATVHYPGEFNFSGVSVWMSCHLF